MAFVRRGHSSGRGSPTDQVTCGSRRSCRPSPRARARNWCLSPANAAPRSIWPRNVVAVYDAVVLSHPEWFSRALVRWHRVHARWHRLGEQNA